MTKILVVEDDPMILELIAKYLQAEGYSITTAADGLAALKLARSGRPDLMVLDLALPGMDGLEVCRRVQQESDVYILMLTARAEEVDRVIGLSVGADDYLTKPFSPRELVARVKAILRRSRPGGAPSARQVPERQPLKFDDLLIDPERHEVWHNGIPVELTQREFELLYVLAEQAGRVFSRDQLLERIWGHDFAGIDRVVDVHVGLLRRKLEADSSSQSRIQTIRGVGYKFLATRTDADQHR